MKDDRYEVKYLLSTFNDDTKQLNMHGVPVALVEEQAKSIGIPLLKVFVSDNSDTTYTDLMNGAFSFLKEKGILRIAFGDIFLTDLRAYREQQLAYAGMECIFPLWKMDTTKLVHDFIDEGFKAYTCCVQDQPLSTEDVGVLITHDFINALPVNTDPCGEKGEYHSFCFDGPIFKQPIAASPGKKRFDSMCLQQNQLNFWFCEMQLNLEMS